MGSQDGTFAPSEQGLLLLRRARSGVITAIVELHALSVLAARQWFALDPESPSPRRHPAKSIARAVTLVLSEASLNTLARAEEVEWKVVRNSMRVAERNPVDVDGVINIVLHLLSDYSVTPSRQLQFERIIDDVVKTIERVAGKAVPEAEGKSLSVAAIKLQALKDKLR